MPVSHSAGVITPLRIIFCITALIHCASSYRLNVPRVLLPFHPSIPVKFVLEVSQPSGGCFKWRSTRPDVVSVSPLDAKAGECSDKAEIQAIPKTVSGELSAVIFAEDSNSGTMLSCGVTVDQIARIRIKTTTKILFVDAAPARILLEALNSEGDTFSTLSEIPVEWELTHSGEGRPLRIVPFEQSTYEAPAEIVALEKKKKKVVPMPSSAYYLKVDAEDICSLDKMTSTIRALARGRTDIHLYSQSELFAYFV
ncbi:hypothetical protein OESDEN_06561 [Oesophagostomum dentatum]|uniref:Uncharacterized protein n=1 Tax=Oesophagostomum dentatum TaxID=61180 RepID=A0A0B1T7I0_OESDE|nr:hypothetical protein OESDEN_06561 [Oesophagostomum dentatum]